MKLGCRPPNNWGAKEFIEGTEMLGFSQKLGLEVDKADQHVTTTVHGQPATSGRLEDN
jgi:hypothetical protein